MDYEALKDYLNKEDRFCVFNKMRLTVIREGYSEAELDVTTDSLNAVNYVQGGALYTLSDFAFAGAANSYGRKCVGLNSTISYIRPGMGKKLKAVAQMVNAGKTTCVCDVIVYNEEGKIVSKSTLTGYFLEQKK